METSSLILTFSAMFLLSGVDSSSSDSSRIYGGFPINITEAPFMAYVIAGAYECSGTILSRQFVMTACHCEFFKIYIRIFLHKTSTQVSTMIMITFMIRRNLRYELDRKTKILVAHFIKFRKFLEIQNMMGLIMTSHC